jgi:hypothetical protein
VRRPASSWSRSRSSGPRARVRAAVPAPSRRRSGRATADIGRARRAGRSGARLARGERRRRADRRGPRGRGRAPGTGTVAVDEQQLRPYRVPRRELVPTSVPTFPWRRETPGYASKRSTYWNL